MVDLIILMISFTCEIQNVNYLIEKRLNSINKIRIHDICVYKHLLMCGCCGCIPGGLPSFDLYVSLN